jgi:hypothetical protein
MRQGVFSSFGICVAWREPFPEVPHFPQIVHQNILADYWTQRLFVVLDFVAGLDDADQLVVVEVRGMSDSTRVYCMKSVVDIVSMVLQFAPGTGL